MVDGANIHLVTSAATHSRHFHPRQAIEQFRETLRLDPANAAAKKFLEQAQAIERRGP